MKALNTFIAALILAPAVMAQAPSGSGHGIEFLPTERKSPVGKAITGAEIEAQRKAAEFGGFAQEAPAVKGWDVLEYSDFIGMDGKYVILPKNSVIHVPDALKGNILAAPAGEMLSWNEFVTRYRGLVTHMDVSLEEVSGAKPIPPERLEAVARTGLIVVAVYERNPITVIRPESASVSR